jgi:vacuolar-type H+-ATPase subunit F/Vma7
MRLAVIADELTALGWRLIGDRVLTSDAAGVLRAFELAQRDADVVLITATLAAELPRAQLEAALRAVPPLLLVIADIANTVAPADIQHEVARALGVAA